MMMRLIFPVLIYLPLLLAAVTIIRLGWRGRPVWTTPHCGGCGYDLRGRDPEQLADCPECGAELGGKRGITYARPGGHRWGVMTWGVVVAIMPVLIVAGFWIATTLQARLNPTRTMQNPSQLATLSTDDLIQHQLPAMIDKPWAWQVLEQRQQQGQLTPAQTTRAVEVMAREMAALKPAGWDGPLHWCDQFLAQAMASGGVDQPAAVAFYRAYHGPAAVIQNLPRLQPDADRFDLGLEYGSDWNTGQLPHELAWRVKTVTVAGKPLAFDFRYHGGNTSDGHVEGTFPSGSHPLVVEIECLLYDKAQFPNVDMSQIPIENWPGGLERWTIQTVAPLEVLDPEVAAIQLVTPAEHAAAIERGIGVPAVAISPGNSGPRATLTVDFDDDLPLAVSFEVAIDWGDGPRALGVVHQVREGTTRRSRTNAARNIPAPPAGVDRTDVILTPLTKPVEEYSFVDEIWGGTIVLRDVPLRRLDLPGGAAE